MGVFAQAARALRNRVKSIQFSCGRGIHLGKKYPGQTTTRMGSSFKTLPLRRSCLVFKIGKVLLEEKHGNRRRFRC
jgi:hypothetical protein